MSEYLTQLRLLWDEYSTLRTIPSCSCTPQCSCEAFKKMKKIQQDDYVIRFLAGLNDEFSTVRSQILLIDPLPKLKMVFSLVIQHERQAGSTLEKFTEPSVLFTQGNTSSQQYRRPMNKS